VGASAVWVKFVIGFGNELLFYCLSGLCPHPRSLSQVEREERQYKFIVNFIILVIHILNLNSDINSHLFETAPFSFREKGWG